MSLIYFLTHPEIQIDQFVPITQWGLSEKGRDRIKQLLLQPWIQDIKRVFSSTETKAIETATIISSHLQIPFTQIQELGEMDRSSTGFLEKKEFEKTADEFFTHPDTSIRGWERAVDAQKRIVSCVQTIVSQINDADSVLIVSHGGVGALLLADLSGKPISRSFDQPGEGGGNYFVFDSASNSSVSPWKSI